MLASAITPLHPCQQDSDLFLRQYFSIKYSRLKTLVSLAVHTLWSIRE
jgi:hypothetical protein